MGSVAVNKPGLLLVNLGTPDGPEAGPVRRYLREFLGDPRVVDMSPIGRWFLLNFIILPFRPAKSAEAYHKVWTDKGSPLLVHGRELCEAVRKKLGDRFEVELGMRYGNPSLGSAVAALRARGATSITLMPLYPQYAASTTGSTLDELARVLRQDWDLEPVNVVPAFFDDEGFLSSFEQVARPVIAGQAPDHVLFTFHGLPERQIRRSDPSGSHCLGSPGCCDALGPHNHRCYRAQSFATARLLAGRLGLPDGKWQVTFQSRLGRTPWIRPYTDEAVVALAKAGVKRLVVISPSFVADCLETLEEIGMRARADFIEHGGQELTLVPSLNVHPRWVDAVGDLAVRNTPAVAQGR